MTPENQNVPVCGLAVESWFASLVEKCRQAEVPKVYASTQYQMGFLLAESGPNGGGIVFRDDAMPHAAREKLADRLNAILANTTDSNS
jgi:hypothetical protein